MCSAAFPPVLFHSTSDNSPCSVPTQAAKGQAPPPAKPQEKEEEKQEQPPGFKPFQGKAFTLKG